MNAPLEKHNVLPVQLSIDKFASMPDIGWDWEVRNVSIVKLFWVINLICETLMSTPKYHGNIDLIHAHCLLHEVGCY